MTTEPLSPLKRAFLALEEAQARLAAVEGAAHEPIAVIGIGCRVPGADGPAAFWELLREGRDAVGPIPRERFDIDAFFDADPAAPGRIAVREAGFLGPVDGFDAGFFGISPREARGMDPQQRLLLEVAWEALEHAGQAPDRLSTSATGVYIGQCSSDYATLLHKSGDPALLDAHFSSGVAHSVSSGDNWNVTLNPRMGMGILVMIAEGRLSRIPMVRPMSQPDHGRSIRQTTNPIAKRSKNAPSRAADLSGKDMGNIVATVRRPKTRPHRMPSINRDILFCLQICSARGQRNRRPRAGRNTPGGEDGLPTTGDL